MFVCYRYYVNYVCNIHFIAALPCGMLSRVKILLLYLHCIFTYYFSNKVSLRILVNGQCYFDFMLFKMKIHENGLKIN